MLILLVLVVLLFPVIVLAIVIVVPRNNRVQLGEDVNNLLLWWQAQCFELFLEILQLGVELIFLSVEVCHDMVDGSICVALIACLVFGRVFKVLKISNALLVTIGLRIEWFIPVMHRTKRGCILALSFSWHLGWHNIVASAANSSLITRKGMGTHMIVFVGIRKERSVTWRLILRIALAAAAALMLSVLVVGHPPRHPLLWREPIIGRRTAIYVSVMNGCWHLHITIMSCRYTILFVVISFLQHPLVFLRLAMGKGIAARSVPRAIVACIVRLVQSFSTSLQGRFEWHFSWVSELLDIVVVLLLIVIVVLPPRLHIVEAVLEF